MAIAIAKVPIGVYSPCFITGAVYGRLCGELLQAMIPDLASEINPGVYSVIGAAAFSSSVTRTVSTAVMVIELTNQMNLLLPVLVLYYI